MERIVHLHSYRIKNYRRLRDVHIELDSDISIFVGSNNSGKTSATQAIHTFVRGSKERFSLYDFCSICWNQFDELGKLAADAELPHPLPTISLDLWFEVTAADLALVLPLLPSTDWQGTQVGIRVEYAARHDGELLNTFRTIRQTAIDRAKALPERENEQYVPWPKSLTDYLKDELASVFEFRYYVLDRRHFDENYRPLPDYMPLPLGNDPGGAAILKSLIRVDNLSAQRHLADPDTGTSSSGGRAENLSKRLSRFYKRNLDQRQDDHNALRALFDSEIGLNNHLATVFEETLGQLSDLGYPGLNNPRLEIRSALNPATIMSSQDARVHFVLGDGDLRLPDSYNGLGFKNLIYMVVEILDLHAAWIAEEERRAPLHLIFIEEPEAHLHAQLQQVFIRKVLDLVSSRSGEPGAFNSQIIVTTHSPHILYERGFRPIRCFRRKTINGAQTTDVLNLSEYYNQIPNDRDFLQRYLKLTHCALFFADAAILVEGNVERLLLPVMIDKEAPTLRSACLSILEVGGAFAHRFHSLIEFLGLTALVITDLDSVTALAANAEVEDEDDATEFEVPNPDARQPAVQKRGRACSPSDAGAITSNQTLIQWLPKMQTVADLFAATADEKVHIEAGEWGAKVRVAYQTPVPVTWNEVSLDLCGRTLEVAFALENATWCQHIDRKHLGLKLTGDIATPTALAERLHKRVGSKSFDKTTFALGILTEPPEQWRVPQYINDGLKWLAENVRIEIPAQEPANAEQTAGVAEAAE
jgi:predicted ATP-dependent endonuclease of OLD family